MFAMYHYIINIFVDWFYLYKVKKYVVCHLI